MSILQQKILADQSRPAIIASIVAGFPTPESFFGLLEKISGVDVIEISVPFSDPAADGPLACEAARNALKNGVSLSWLLKLLASKKDTLKSAIVLSGYMNPFMQYGFEKLAEDAANAGISGLMIKDLPLEEAEDFQRILSGHNLELIFAIGANTPDDRLKSYARIAGGYVFLIAGNKEQGTVLLKRCRSIFSIPMAMPTEAGSLAEITAQPLAERPDALIFGESLLKYINNGGDGADFVNKI